MKKANPLNRLPRRAVLAGLGSGAAATFLRPLSSRAQAAAAPQRLLIIHRPLGTVPEKWWPTGGVTNWKASEILTEFETLRNDMVILNGINCPRLQGWQGSQPAAGMLAMMTPPPAFAVGWALTGPANDSDPNTRAITATDASIDQLLLQQVPALSGAPIPSLQMAMSSQSTSFFSSVSCLSYALPLGQALATPLTPQSDPAVVLKALLDVLPDPKTTAALNESLYAFVSGDITRLRDRAPTSQAPKLDAHLEAIKQLETELDAAACALPQLTALPPITNGATKNEAQYDTVCDQQRQLIKAAFACDLTRVISLSFDTAESNLRFDKILPSPVGASDGLYGLTQTTTDTAVAAHVAVEKYFAAKTAQLLLDLKTTPDASGVGSLLDNTLVVYLSETSTANTHGIENMPVLVFGGKFLGLNGGSFLTFNGRSMSDFWVATAHAFGYEELTAFGAAEWNKGPLAGLYG